MKRILGALLAAFSLATFAAPITLTVNGIWETPATSSNFTIVAIASDATDKDPRPQVGLYPVKELTFYFTELGKFKTQFSLFADPGASQLQISKSDDGSGELRYFGSMLAIPTFPNGSPPTEFDMRLSFSKITEVDLSTLTELGAYREGTLYLTDGNSARSSLFLTSNVSVSDIPLPEPGSAMLIFLGMIALVLVRLKTFPLAFNEARMSDH
ncbi:hypothetical protein [Methyloversatilis sp.]|uniref:hypothetical protein n=1 Tax=Methyloversatilis sp. TaxID=2569862 RepID=UPI002737336C|nr:hypothetical protein [Methyloversatilis sp.]MDP3456747.1 hypothetical protein [Methyloversatilis sp.]MDP3576983.1 hypothetical protein [Methyloversatilis sp.]